MKHPRGPIVTILGHVDHGKTSLLDFIRKSRLTEKEHGGITQRIGAYEIATGLEGYATDKITFIDTPGHEAFSKLRSRGATVADIAILVIDAKDSLKPQTIESIEHIKAAKIPYVVALNKMDLPEANPNKVKIDLLKYEVMVEDKGGTVPAVGISAKNGDGIPDLLETLLFIASDLKLEYDDESTPEAYIIETKKDKRGVVVSIVIKNGKISVGDDIFSVEDKARVRTMFNDLNKPVREIIPSMPAEILGFAQPPAVGTMITSTIGKKPEEAEPKSTNKVFPDLDAYFSGVPTEKKKQLSIILKADTQGSLDAIVETIAPNKNIIIQDASIGEINKSDIFLAKTTKSLVIGFSVDADAMTRELSKQEKVIIKTYDIIYELLEELEEVSTLLQEKENQEKNLKGEGKVQATFIIEGETIYGVKVSKGKIANGDSIELFRDNKSVGKTKLVSLKTRAKIIQEVKKDQECGMMFYPLLDMKVGDVIKCIL